MIDVIDLEPGSNILTRLESTCVAYVVDVWLSRCELFPAEWQLMDAVEFELPSHPADLIQAVSGAAWHAPPQAKAHQKEHG